MAGNYSKPCEHVEHGSMLQFFGVCEENSLLVVMGNGLFGPWIHDAKRVQKSYSTKLAPSVDRDRCQP